MLFEASFLDTLKGRPLEGLITICSTALNKINPSNSSWSNGEYLSLLEAFTIIEGMQELGLTPLHFSIPQLQGDANVDCPKLVTFTKTVMEQCNIAAKKKGIADMRAYYRNALGTGFSYEFSQGDLERLQELINEVRGLVATTDSFEPDHRKRLLARLEKLQSELHKRVSDLDRFWGLIGDAGVVLGKFGSDAKPLIDRIREITKIVWQTQSRAEELPSGTSPPALPEVSDRVDDE